MIEEDISDMSQSFSSLNFKQTCKWLRAKIRSIQGEVNKLKVHPGVKTSGPFVPDAVTCIFKTWGTLDNAIAHLASAESHYESAFEKSAEEITCCGSASAALKVAQDVIDKSQTATASPSAERQQGNSRLVVCDGTVRAEDRIDKLERRIESLTRGQQATNCLVGGLHSRTEKLAAHHAELLASAKQQSGCIDGLQVNVGSLTNRLATLSTQCYHRNQHTGDSCNTLQARLDQIDKDTTNSAAYVSRVHDELRRQADHIDTLEKIVRQHDVDIEANSKAIGEATKPGGNAAVTVESVPRESAVNAFLATQHAVRMEETAIKRFHGLRRLALAAGFVLSAGDSPELYHLQHRCAPLKTLRNATMPQITDLLVTYLKDSGGFSNPAPAPAPAPQEIGHGAEVGYTLKHGI